jgi:hypothetical protein
MERDLVKRFIKKDGSQRISFYRDEFADNPRDNTDEPLHCCDWERNHSITTKVDPSYSDARSLINQMLVWYGKREVIIDALCNGIENNRLEYNRSARRWELKEYIKFYSEKEYKWYDAEYFDGRKDEIDLGTLVEACLDSTIDELCDEKYWTDGVKMMSYSFGYYGEISFDREFSTDSEGIAWLEKDEALKDWIKEEYWDKEDCYDLCDGMRNELEAWGDNEVYGFVVENRIEYKVHKEYTNVEREAEDSVEEEWEEKDSCWGFYGELDDEHIGYILDGAGFKREELEEVD